MSDETFENLEARKEGMELSVRVYELTRRCRDFDFRSQIRRAALSISSNFAEGYERDSNQEFIRYLFIAKGSCGEVRSQAYLAQRVSLFNEDDAAAVIADAKRLSRRIMRLIEARRSRFE